MSLREIIEGERFWPLDPVRPATGSSLHGHGFPYGRDESRRCNPDQEDCIGTWSGDASYLPDSVNRDLIHKHSYDFGHAHREDKGVFESIRCSPLQAPGGDVSYEGYGDMGQSVSELLHRHRNATVQDVLLFNCKLTHVGTQPGFFGNNKLPDPGPADFHERKHEIGRMLKKEGFDVAALCELFKARSGDPGPDVRRQADVVERRRGPGQDTEILKGRFTSQDSGLELMCLENEAGPTPSIVEDDQDTFSVTKPDNKGWLYTALDLGAGEIDMFLTHTAGNLDEITELVDGVQNYGKPQNPTVLVGDLNIADTTAAYNEMLRIFGEAGLQDAWLSRGGIEGTTELPNTDVPPHDLKACKDYERGIDGEPACACNDYPVADEAETTRCKRYRHKNGKRIDFVFVERPRARHAVNLDLSRINRRAFPRLGPCGYGTWDDDDTPNMRYLSDHMGLAFRVVVSEKRFTPPMDPLSLSLSNVRLSKGQPRIPWTLEPIVVVEATLDLEYQGEEPLPAVQVSPRLSGYRFDPGWLDTSSGDTVNMRWDSPTLLRKLKDGTKAWVTDPGTIRPDQRGKCSIRIELAAQSLHQPEDDLRERMYDGFEGLDIDTQVTSIRGASDETTHTRSTEQVKSQ